MSHDTQYRLDQCNNKITLNACAWCPLAAVTGEWLQVTSEYPRDWQEIVIQGREHASANHWVTKFSIIYSNDGINWTQYVAANGDTVFPGNTDQTSKVSLTLSPRINARTLRIVEEEFTGWPCMRVGAKFVMM